MWWYDALKKYYTAGIESNDLLNIDREKVKLS